MTKFLDFFDRIFIINLPHRTDRLRDMTAELEKADMAIASSKVEVFPAIRPDGPGSFTSTGAHGAFLSHLSVLKKAQAQGLNKVLILEDDLEFKADFLQHQSALIHELSHQNWDIVHFGYCSTGHKPTFDLPTLKPFAGEIIGAQFYAVSSQALDELIPFLETLLARPAQHPDGGPMPIDGAFNVYKWQYPQQIRLLAIPSFGGQRSSRSDISPKWFDGLPLVRLLVGSLRNWEIYKKFKRFAKRAPIR
jgi:glycosyl transferase family 25